MLARDRRRGKLLKIARKTCPTCGSSRIRLLDVTSNASALISGCRQCGLVFLNPMPTPEEITERYAPGGAWSRKLEKSQVGQEERKRLKAAQQGTTAATWIADRAALLYQAGARDVLDYGCGDGRLLNMLQERGWNTFGIDPNVTAIAQHQMLDTIPEQPSFDLIIMHHVLEHLDDPLHTLRAARRAMRQDGYLFIASPTLDRLARHGKKDHCINRQHVTAYTARSLRSLLGLAGFELVRQMPPSAPHRLAFIYRAGQPSRKFWPLRDAQIAFLQLANTRSADGADLFWPTGSHHPPHTSQNVSVALAASSSSVPYAV